MALPEFQTMMRPLLEQLADSHEAASAELRAALSQHFSLTPADLRQENRSGRNRYTNLVAWALHHLSRARLVERRGPSVYRITERGSEVLATHAVRVDIAVCAEFDEWHHSHARRSARASAPVAQGGKPKWRIESDRALECLKQHDWWERHPRLLRESVPRRAEKLAAVEGKNVYQQHVLRAAADAVEETNNTIHARRKAAH